MRKEVGAMTRRKGEKKRAKATSRPTKSVSARDAAERYARENQDIATAVEAMRVARLSHDSLAQYQGRRAYRSISS